MLKALQRILLLAAVVYLGMNVLMYASQRDYMYLPATERVLPRDAGFADVAEVRIRNAAGAELLSWYLAPPPGRPTVLFLHGNAGAVYHRTHRVRALQSAGFGVFLLGYPGYGGSGGEPGEASLVEAAGLAYRYLLDAGVSADRIVIWGESIGTGVAVQLAAGVEAKALVLEAPMSSASDVAAEHYPLMVARFFMTDTYRSVDYIDRIGMPLLVMHGDRDRVIPLQLGEKLIARAADPKALDVIEGAGHNDLYQFGTDAIARNFIETL